MKKSRDLALLSLIVCAVIAGCAKKTTPSTAQSPTTDTTASNEPIAALPEGSNGADTGASYPTIYFEYDQSTLSQEARTQLQAIAPNLKSAASKLTIEGHCDERGSNEYNLALGENRARAVRDYLRKLGVPADKLNAVSFGEERPAVPGQSESAWVKNRRAELSIGN